MKKIIKWQSVLILAIFFGVLLMAQVIYKDDTKLPSDHWSRNIAIENIASNDAFYESYYDVLILNDHAYLIEKVDHQLKIFMLEAKGQFTQVKTFDISEYDHDYQTLSVGVRQDQSISLLLSNGDNLASFTLNDTLSDLELQNDIQDNLKNVYINQGKALYYKQDRLMLFDGRQEIQLSQTSDFEQYSFAYNDHLDQYAFSLLRYDNGSYYSDIMTYDGLSQTVTHHTIEKLPLVPGTVSINTDTYRDKGHLYSAMTLKNKKFGENYHFIYDLDDAQFNVLKSYRFNTSAYTPHLQFVRIGDEVKLSSNQATFIGKTGIGSNRETYTNVVTSDFDNQMPVAHTKSNVAAANVVWFQMDQGTYLVTNEMINGQNVLYVSSNAPDVIKESQSHMGIGNYLNILLNAITFIPSSIMPLFVPLISLMIPVILVVIPVAIIKMSWVERHQNRMLALALISYLIFKIRYLYINRETFIFDTLNYGVTPIHLSSGLGLFLTGLITTLISGLCLWLFVKDKPESHFIQRFGFFFLIDMLMLLIFFIPYTMMFL